ncbi:TetR/AcrR family transcriptional regulator [Halopseudomonas pachastrellae]|uniref:TetR/AcrR family transcriptional regulator n=1 Tax=Halopseudomonas pachastrellae TaxID=254161 RepID=UPI003D7F037D|tara:strand:- start:2532 stop:3167 length:636 start_codon:yes stop_codon:yes gene_type:complete
MNSVERREREKQERRESILDSAEQCFFSKGYERTSMDEIAKGAQLSRALLYVYFKDKAAIMRGVMLRAGYALLTAFRAAQAAGGSGLVQLERMGRSYYRFSLEQPNYFDVLTNASTFAHLMDNDEQTEELSVCSELAMGCMVESMQTGVADGSLSRERVADPQLTAYYLRGALHGVILQTRQQEDASLAGQPAAEQLLDYTMLMLNQSLRA